MIIQIPGILITIIIRWTHMNNKHSNNNKKTNNKHSNMT